MEEKWDHLHYCHTPFCLPWGKMLMQLKWPLIWRGSQVLWQGKGLSWWSQLLHPTCYPGTAQGSLWLLLALQTQTLARKRKQRPEKLWMKLTLSVSQSLRFLFSQSWEGGAGDFQSRCQRSVKLPQGTHCHRHRFRELSLLESGLGWSWIAMCTCTWRRWSKQSLWVYTHGDSVKVWALSYKLKNDTIYELGVSPEFLKICEMSKKWGPEHFDSQNMPTK